MLEVALRQAGSEAARQSLSRAAAASAASKDGSGVGIIEVSSATLWLKCAFIFTTSLSILTRSLILGRMVAIVLLAALGRRHCELRI